MEPVSPRLQGNDCEVQGIHLHAGDHHSCDSLILEKGTVTYVPEMHSISENMLTSDHYPRTVAEIPYDGMDQTMALNIYYSAHDWVLVHANKRFLYCGVWKPQRWHRSKLHTKGADTRLG